MKSALLTIAILSFSFTAISQRKIAEEYKEKGTKFAKEGNYTEAIENLDRAIQIDPTYAAAYNNRGIVNMELKKYNEALDDFNRAIKNNPLDPAFLINRALVNERLDLLEKAVEDYSKAIEIDPFTADIYMKRGILYDQLKKYKEAVDDFDMALKFTPDNADLYYYRGLAKLSSEEFYDGHRDFFKAAEMGHFKSKNLIAEVFFDNYPDDEELAMNIRCSMKMYLKDYEGAVKDLDRLIKISPKNGKYYLNRGLAKIHLEDKKNGCKDIKKAMDYKEFDANEEYSRYCE